MKLGSSRAMDTKRPRGSERSKPCHELQLTRGSQPPYPWPPEQAQPRVSKPCRTTGGERVIVSERDLAKAEAVAAKLGGEAQAMSIADALKNADILILAI